MPHEVLEGLGTHAGLRHVAAVGVAANVRGDVRHLYPEDVVVAMHRMVEAMFPVHCNFRHPILVQEKPLAKQIFKQVQFRYDLEPVLIRKHDLNYVQALERLYAKEAQTLEGKLNQKNAESSPMICALDQQIHKITQEIKQIEGDLSKFKWCWSKEKRTQKENLTERLSNLSSYAQRLHAQRRLWSVIR